MIGATMVYKKHTYRNTAEVINGHLPESILSVLEFHIGSVVMNFIIHTESNYQYGYEYLQIDSGGIYTHSLELIDIDDMVDDCFWCESHLKDNWKLYIEKTNPGIHTLSMHFKNEEDCITFKLARR